MEITRNLYDYPRYYEIVFSFRDIKHEVDVFEECIRRSSKIPVRRALELGSGTTPTGNAETRLRIQCEMFSIFPRY